MPLTLQSFNFAIICDENELETYDVKQQGPNSTTAFIASEAGKVSLSKIPFASMRMINCRDQQFNIAISNLSDYDLLVALHIDGEFIKNNYLRIGEQGAIRGFRTSAITILPFKFQELELVGAFHGHHVCSLLYYLLLKIRTWNMPLPGQKWGPLNFEPFAAGIWAIGHFNRF